MNRIWRYLIGFGVAITASMVVLHYSGLTGLFLVMQAYVGVAATAFTVVYHTTARWWASAMGRNIMLLIASIAAILDLGFCWNLLGRPEWMRYGFVALFFAVGTAIFQRLGILIDAQYHSDDHVDKNPAEES